MIQSAAAVDLTMRVKASHFKRLFVVCLGPSMTQFRQLNYDSHLIRNDMVLNGSNVDSIPPVYEYLTQQCIDWTLIFRFHCDKSANGNFELISLDGIKAGAEQHWELSVGGVSELMNINEYIPSNGVEVLFRLETTTIETVNVNLGILLKYTRNQNR